MIDCSKWKWLECLDLETDQLKEDRLIQLEMVRGLGLETDQLKEDRLIQLEMVASCKSGKQIS